MTEEKAPQDTIPGTENNLPLHISEYEALMTRNTYWTTIQFSVAPAIAIYLTLLVTAWEAIKIVNPNVDSHVYEKHLLWLSLLGAELFVLAGYNCIYEIYNNVRFVETHLRPEINKIVKSPQYWMYEKFLEGQRGIAFLVVECWASIAVLAAECVIATKEFPWSKTDYIWFVATALIAIFVALQNLNVTKMRLRHFH
jgi:hypothetical protein